MTRLDFDQAIALRPNYAWAYGYCGIARLHLVMDASPQDDLRTCPSLDSRQSARFQALVNDAYQRRAALAAAAKRANRENRGGSSSEHCA